MKKLHTIVIGAGQAGLAMSRCLRDRGVEHVVLERGRVAERWRSERWDSLRLLTPRWQSRLPGYRYSGPDPDGYMTMPEVVAYLGGYARSFAAPVEEGTTVLSLAPGSRGYRVLTDRGSWEAWNVAIATGYCDVPFVPAFAAQLPRDVVQVVPTRYRRPADLPEGGVLVVGASASGVQLADEIHASGRPVTLAVSRHTRLPRLYRGRDILWWLDARGARDETADRVYDLEASRRQPSLQLVGRPDHSTLDLPLLERRGVRLVGRAVGGEGATVFFADDLVAHTAAADVRLARLLSRIDDFVASAGLSPAVEEAEPFEPFLWPAPAPAAIDLRAEGIRTVVWATGFRRHYPWLGVPVLDERGELRHDGGVTPARGLFVLGLTFQRRRKSTFIDGVGDDARELADRIAGAGQARAVA
ncbi:MAG TPA: NAD(P)/FAD-dependent oxidoreductase [Vicinamibacteria bacterium]